MHRHFNCVVAIFPVAFVACVISTARGDSPRDLAHTIDRHVDRQLPDAAQTTLVGESGFIRRVTLDLAGRIPTVAELQSFRGSESLNKRAELVQRLIDSPDFAFHQRNELDTILLRRLTRDEKWREYLLEATRENRRWDTLFREIMSPEDARPDDLRPVAFLKQRVNDVDTMANDASVIWFGVNVGCAKCHDHPLADDWKQAHYYGLASFFKRTFTTRKGFLSERFDGTINYETTDGEKHDAEFMFLTGTTVAEPENQLDKETLKKYQEAIKKSEKDDKAEPPPRPDFRPRARLVDLALADTEQRFFARNIVNRVWARMLGRGLVHPVDQMHSGNPASHPELLELLSRDLVEHGYDLKRLVHAIALSDTYARRMESVSSPAQVSDEYFAAAIPRPLSPHQLSLSLIIATRSPEVQDAEWPRRREELERESDATAQRIEYPDDGFQVPISEALWFSNNAEVQRNYLGAGHDRLVGYLSQIESDDELVRTAARSILTRDPAPQEVATMTAYLGERNDRRVDAIQHIVWALLGSPEFRFNH